MGLIKERLDIIFGGLSQGKKADEIQDDLRRQARVSGREKGATTETEFKRRVWAHLAWVVKDLRDSTPEEDMIGADFFITMKEGGTLPVQVKSSDPAVEEFRNDKRYTEVWGKRIIVINSAPYVSKDKFKDRFFRELHRIRRLDKI